MQRNTNWYFLGVLQHEQRHKWEKQFGSKYFLAYCFINILVNYLLPTARYVMACNGKSLSGICCDNICSFYTTYIIEACLEPFWPSCGHVVKSTLLLGLPNEFKFCYTQSHFVETRNSSNIVLSYFHSYPLLMILMQKTLCQSWAVFCLNWPV